jgi:hypothetical protein
MDDSSVPATNDDRRLFDSNLDRLDWQGARRDGGGLGGAAHDAKSQNGGDDAIPKAVHRSTASENRHLSAPDYSAKDALHSVTLQ